MYGRLYLWLVRRLQLIMDNIYPKIAYMGEKAKSLSLFLFGFLVCRMLWKPKNL